MEHDAVLLVVVHHVVLNGHVVAPLRSDDAVVTCKENTHGRRVGEGAQV